MNIYKLLYLYAYSSQPAEFIDQTQFRQQEMVAAMLTP
jgi:hypothetical protein